MNQPDAAAKQPAAKPSDMRKSQHHKHRRRHKRQAREFLLKLLQDETKTDATRIKAAQVLLTAPGRAKNFSAFLKDLLPFV